jgi:hypothetical protein
MEVVVATAAELGNGASSTTGRLRYLVMVVRERLRYRSETDFAGIHLKTTRALRFLP